MVKSTKAIVPNTTPKLKISIPRNDGLHVYRFENGKQKKNLLSDEDLLFYVQRVLTIYRVYGAKRVDYSNSEGVSLTAILCNKEKRMGLIMEGIEEANKIVYLLIKKSISKKRKCFLPRKLEKKKKQTSAMEQMESLVL